MAEADQGTSPQFSQPIGQIVVMISILVAVAAGAFVALPRVLPVFEANPYLNGFIAFVFVLGVLSCFWQVAQLITSVRWLEEFASDDLEAGKAPQLLAPLATLLRARGRAMQINATSTRSILDSVSIRIDEMRDITRYIVNLLIFLGLLGTFYGLATTVPAVVDTIANLAPKDGETGEEVFSRLLSGLGAQMDGMGVAFASSLLGLAGSLVVGLLELFAGRGQNRFYRELEEWLSTITRVGFASGEDAGGDDTTLVAAAMDHMADQMDNLRVMLENSDASRAEVDARMGHLTTAMERLSQKFDAGDGATEALRQIAMGQERLIGLFERQGPGEGIDAESRMRLRSIDVQMLRILEEISAGRQESVSELRGDINALAAALRPDRTGPRRLRVRTDPPDGAGG